jgi:lipoyl(octanoyl) transferase
VVAVDRGGQADLARPGQLVGLPDPRPARTDEGADYVAILEDVIIAVLKDYGLEGIRIDGTLRGLACRGERTARPEDRRHRHPHQPAVTMHGFAVNCSNSLAPFEQIVPCGITDAGVTSISAETGRTVPPSDIVSRIEEELRKNESALVLDDAATTLPDGPTDDAGADQPKGALL